jgi:hypothetical protein
VDDGIGGLCGLGENFGIIQRANHRIDPARLQHWRLVLGSGQAYDVMARCDELLRDGAPNIAGGSCDEYFHAIAP